MQHAAGLFFLLTAFILVYLTHLIRSAVSFQSV